ncbi:hypothetical protein [Paenibacillus sp. 2003]|uniref:hypothetical protein n=1 Tax=Paenibacillus sp. 2003 TaxID=2817761 RepID=UPI002859D471|nr:hypothetical protein [Paenibacillus sp. 2003]MDR6720888.1 hypothetical protein [Paenibacillus sp. 2003]
MKKTIFLIFVVVMAGCGTETDQAVQDVTSKVQEQFSNITDQNNEKVLGVKNGYFQSYPNESIGEAFDHFFENNTWKYFKTESSEDVVEFTGNTVYREAKVKARLQFIIDKTSGFEVAALSFNDVPQDNMIKAALLKSVFESGASTEETKSTSMNNEMTSEAEEASREVTKEVQSEQNIISKNDVFPELSYDEKKRLNLFFSNLSEAYFNQFNKDNYNTEKLIDFAVIHNKINYPKRIKTEQVKGEFYDTLENKYVVDTIKRFFGINIKTVATQAYSLKGGEISMVIR